MELAKVTSKGQITIPKDVREKMKLKTGDKILFFEENGRFFLQNSNFVALTNLQKGLEGVAEEIGFNSSDDVVNYMKQLRRTNKK